MRQFIRVENNSPLQYPIAANVVWQYAPHGTGFPLDCSDADLTAFGFEIFQLTDPPSYDPDTQRLQEVAPVKVNGVWTQQWQVVALTGEEIVARRESLTPEAVTAAHAKLALYNAGLYDTVSASIAHAYKGVQIYWESATEFQRYHPYILGMAAECGFDDETVDNLFIAASKLN